MDIEHVKFMNLLPTSFWFICSSTAEQQFPVAQFQ